MGVYKGDVIDSPNEDFPFIAIVTDASGTVVSEVPVRTRADGEAMIAEAIQELEDHDRKGGDTA